MHHVLLIDRVKILAGCPGGYDRLENSRRGTCHMKVIFRRCVVRYAFPFFSWINHYRRHGILSYRCRCCLCWNATLAAEQNWPSLDWLIEIYLPACVRHLCLMYTRRSLRCCAAAILLILKRVKNSSNYEMSSGGAVRHITIYFIPPTISRV